MWWISKWKLLVRISEFSIESKSKNGVSILLKCFINIIRVRNIFSSLDLLTMKISLSEYLLSSRDIFLNLLDKEYIINLNKVSRHSIVQKTWWEHHIVSFEPELNSILCIELRDFSCLLQSATSEYEHGGPEIHVQSWVVKGTVWESKESGSDWSHSCEEGPHAHPEVIDDSESSEECVLTVFSFSHLQSLEDSSDQAWSFC